MLNFIDGDWHGWRVENGQFLLSDEATKRLYSFADADAAITWLYMNDHKPAARALNAIAKARGE